MLKKNNVKSSVVMISHYASLCMYAS